MPSSEISCQAFAKLNLGLEVLGRRTDGLHEVATIMQSITLADQLSFRPAKNLTLQCRGMAVTDDNLILRAARLFQAMMGTQAGAAITCSKRIPFAAGLGGGSADAGATLRALNVLWGCGLDTAALAAAGGQLGADVPFAVTGGTALASGTGRDIISLPTPSALWVLLLPASDDTGDKTPSMYSSLRSSDFSTGQITGAQVKAIAHGHVDAGRLHNAFARSATERWPSAAEALRLVLTTGALGAAFTGAGPSAYGLFATRTRARIAARLLRGAQINTIICRFIAAPQITEAFRNVKHNPAAEATVMV